MGGSRCRRTATGTQEELRADAPRGSQTPPGVLAAAPLPRVRVLGSPAEWGTKAPHGVTCSPSGSSTPGSLGPAPRPPCPEAGQGRSAAGRGEELELPKSCE